MAAAGTVVIAVLIALTLIPAAARLRGQAGTAPQGAARPTRRPACRRRRRDGQRPSWARAGRRFVLRRPADRAWSRAVLGAGRRWPSPATQMELGLPDEGNQPPDTTQRKAYDMLSDSFGAGFNGPLMTVDRHPRRRRPPRPRRGGRKRLKKIDGVVAVTPRRSSTRRATPPPDRRARRPAPATPRPRTLVHASAAGRATSSADDRRRRSLVTGQTAMAIDFSQTLDDALLPYLGAGRRPGLPAPDAGLPLGAGAAEGGARLPALGGRRARRGGRGLPVGLARGPGRRGAAGPDHEHDADLHDRRGLRPGHGLRGLPRHADARGVRPRGAPRRGRRHRLHAMADGW